MLLILTESCNYCIAAYFFYMFHTILSIFISFLTSISAFFYFFAVMAFSFFSICISIFLLNYFLSQTFNSIVISKIIYIIQFKLHLYMNFIMQIIPVNLECRSLMFQIQCSNQYYRNHARFYS